MGKCKDDIRVTFVDIVRCFSCCTHWVLYKQSHLMLKATPKDNYLLYNCHFSKEETEYCDEGIQLIRDEA